jgi:hypothetical protein
MFIDATSLVRRRYLAWILLTSMMCLPASGWAQHGGAGHSGGGHTNGGHSGGGHSSHTRSTRAQTGGHLFGWLHFNFRNRSGSRGAAPPANPADTFLRSAELRKRAPIHALPSTSIRTIPLDSPKFLAGKESSTPSRFRHQPRLLLGRFPCVHSSGCFFNGFNQVCFFEAALPVVFWSGFYWPFFDIGLGGDAMDQPGDLTWADTMPTGVAADTYSALANPPSTSAASVGPPSEFPGKGLDPRFFLLILKNGTDLVVTDYWAADGYIEYVSRDGSRSHIPIEALDLQASVTANSYRGLPFMLRSVPPEP